MPLRLKLALYLAAIHAVLGGVALLALRDRPLWLLAAEALFALSLVLGWLLVRAFFVPLQLIRTGAELVAEEDFTSTFRPVGQPEMDALIGVYNRMIERAPARAPASPGAAPLPGPGAGSLAGGRPDPGLRRPGGPGQPGGGPAAGGG
jgi:hypothetical protein